MEWISINKSLPNEGDYVLTFPGFSTHLYGIQTDGNESDGIKGAFSEWDEIWETSIEVDYITHWIPSPEPPKQ